MTEKRRQALSLQEYEKLAEAVREYPCLYDKAKKEYKQQNCSRKCLKGSC